MPRKVFVAGEILTAADVNANLMDQAVMVFDDAAARTTAIPSPVEGMVTYLKDTDKLEKYTTDWVDAAPGKILQVVSQDRSTSTTTTSSSFVTSELTATITPTSTSSRVFITYHAFSQVTGSSSQAFTTIFRGTVSDTNLGNGNEGLTQARSTASTSNADVTLGAMHAANIVDSPNTTSAQTYTLAFRRVAGGSGGSLALFSGGGKGVLTLMEVAG